jgi:membrane fusion protein (multidrug efflux system)
MTSTDKPALKEPQMLQTLTAKLKPYLVPTLIFLMAAVILVAIIGNWNSWASERAEQETDDAYVRADLTPLSTKVSGVVVKVLVDDYQTVKAGDLLVQLRDDDFRAQVAQAEAAVEAAKAAIEDNRRQKDLQNAKIDRAKTGIDLAKAQISAAQAAIEATKADVDRTLAERARQEALIATQSATQQHLEQAVADEQRFRAQVLARQADLEQAKANLANNQTAVTAETRARAVLDSHDAQLRADLHGKQASLDAAKTNLDYTRIYAPESGVVGERKVRPGQMVSPGTQVLSLVQTVAWVQANYRETQVRHMRPGAPAEISVDAFPGVHLKGKLVQVAPASGSQFALLPPDNATGNFTKIVQRVPVKIVFDPGQPIAQRLRPGLSVIARVRTTAVSE